MTEIEKMEHSVIIYFQYKKADIDKKDKQMLQVCVCYITRDCRKVIKLHNFLSNKTLM